ncbi:MAG TPA: asparagine synthase C-terminal domain-containing protein [Phycisphaerales bacterium]|nr:asparagine synthase C-terminal domain-containing protein [Phycisphaerales bacterium]
MGRWNERFTRLETDVPLGAFLSGGIDSALVCSYARRLRPDLTAFTVRMPDPSYDESDVAAESARAIGIRHEVLTCDVRVAQDLTDAIRTLGLPFGDSSLLPSTWVSRSARGAIPVALTGDGGDEMFMGYDRQRVIPAVYRLSKLPQSVLRAAAASTPPSAEPRSRRARARRLLWAAAGHGYKDLAAIFPPPLDASVNATAGVHNGMTSNQLGLQGAQDLARRFDLMFYLPCDLMRKSDTASMSVALEARSPMLARELANMCMDASVDSLMPRGQRKGLLRAVARRHLPAHIVDRPKMGFAIPIGDWFRTDYGGLRTLLLDHMNSTEPFGPPSLGIDLNMAFVRQMLDEHLGTGKSGLVTRDHSQRLYMLLVLSIWAKWLGGLTLRSA